VVVRRHNLVDAAPFAQIDLLLCRNTLLYFTPATQARALAHLHTALADDGFLTLGRSETIWYSPGAFEWADRRQRIVAKAASCQRTNAIPTMPGGLVAGNGCWDGGVPPSHPGPVPHDVSRHPLP
jgi:two-component system CheB/CheR fusion protein